MTKNKDTIKQVEERLGEIIYQWDMGKINFETATKRIKTLITKCEEDAVREFEKYYRHLEEEGIADDYHWSEVIEKFINERNKG